MYSHTFTLFWSRKTSVIVEVFQLSFCVFVCAFPLEISSFFGKSFLFVFLFFVLSRLMFIWTSFCFEGEIHPKVCKSVFGRLYVTEVLCIGLEHEMTYSLHLLTTCFVRDKNCNSSLLKLSMYAKCLAKCYQILTSLLRRCE